MSLARTDHMAKGTTREYGRVVSSCIQALAASYGKKWMAILRAMVSSMGLCFDFLTFYKIEEVAE